MKTLALLAPFSASAVAIALAVLAAACFGTAAVLQHLGVGHAVTAADGSAKHSHLRLAGFLQLLTHRVWLGGLAILVLGCALHVLALILAPITLIQPIGVLAVPFAVLLAARLSRQRPKAGVMIGVAMCVLSVGALVWVAAGKVVSVPAEGASWLFASAVVGGILVVLGVVAVLSPRWMRCVSCAISAAVAFGFGSALLRAVSQYIKGDFDEVFTGTSLGMLAIIVAALSIGGWFVQQAYASGPPEVVIACLTVVDPVVAVIVGLTLLSEGASLDAATGVAMIGCGVLAVAGVGTLVRHHPDATSRHTPDAPSNDAGTPPALGGRNVRQNSPERNALENPAWR